MSFARQPAPPAPQPRRPARTLGTAMRPVPTAAAIARRRWMVALTKWLLPLAALALLGTLVAWPELNRDLMHGRISFGRGMAMPQSGQLTDVKYHGVDNKGRPYTVTASVARQVSPERFNLTGPTSDISMDSGVWLMVKARRGVFIQGAQQLDLDGEVTLYRDDGTTLLTDAADVDLKAGAAASNAMTHAEGPFGTLDSQGFTALDNGTVIRFPGPGRLVLNAAGK